MNPIIMETSLRLAGLILTGLVAANFVAAKRWNYSDELAGTATIVRQIFHVHCAYIVAIITALAILCLGWPHLLMDDGMGRALSGFFGLFWASRVVVQLSYYDRELRSENRFWDLFFLAVFSALAAIFTLTAFFQ